MPRFSATLYKVSTDSDGATRLQLDVPLEDLDKVVPLAALNGKLLSVEVSVDPSNG